MPSAVLSTPAGIGSGWFEKDYDQYGYEFGTAGSRLNLLGSYLPRIASRFEQLNPAPTRQIPVLIGGGGERKTLRFVAEYASIWHVFGRAEVLRHKSSVLAGHCETVGRDPGEIERSTAAPGSGVEAADALVADGFTLLTVPMILFREVRFGEVITLKSWFRPRRTIRYEDVVSLTERGLVAKHGGIPLVNVQNRAEFEKIIRKLANQKRIKLVK
jgi:alkanesulfonate monooxygenase SsuD/methylene tetrahydromethanopterin reductase-like flavin-dependent oxidoreductase (luciferase family)